ncbi:unnamed protein product [Ceratitis capitata]|uniref:(Mediterranean fruit fly) hypothetical protein n=1 Tax=Ceratitis capitata TaxID=7213 RepID=A0A811VG84_CERCA|nr:unnamed protein product [Ceratitis capitata]
MKQNDPLPRRNSSKFLKQSTPMMTTTTTATTTSATASTATTTPGTISTRGNNSASTTVITTTTNSASPNPNPTAAGPQQQNIIYNETISALIRGLHDTGIRDINTLHLPLVDERSEVMTQQSTLPQTNSTPNTFRSKPRPKSEMTPHSSLPRLIINIDPADGEGCSAFGVGAGGGSGGVGRDAGTCMGSNGSYTTRSLSPDDLESAKQNGTGGPLSPGGRRFSQFNFALRRFSHVHNPVVFGKSPKIHVFQIHSNPSVINTSQLDTPSACFNHNKKNLCSLCSCCLHSLQSSLHLCAPINSLVHTKRFVLQELKNSSTFSLLRFVYETIMSTHFSSFFF